MKAKAKTRKARVWKAWAIRCACDGKNCITPRVTYVLREDAEFAAEQGCGKSAFAVRIYRVEIREILPARRAK
jgi:hypothetical protein